MRCCLLFVLVVKCVPSLGQLDVTTPRIGEHLPTFALEGVKYCEFENVDNNTFRGKWLFLHFWSLGCSAAIQSLDVADSIQKSFPNDMQVLLIGHKYGPMNEEGLEKVFERKRKTKKYNLSIVYDTILYQQWSVVGVPSIYIVDPNGVLRYVTSGGDLNVEKVESILAGQKVALYPVQVEYLPSGGSCLFDSNSDNGNMVYASVLTKWAGERPSARYVRRSTLTRPQVESPPRKSSMSTL